MAENSQKKKNSKINLEKLLLDIVLTVAFMLAMEPRFTGLALHEWLSLALWVAITIHLLINWRWIVRTTTHFFKPMKGRIRLYYLLDIALFISFSVMNVSGLIISRVFDTAIRLGLSPDAALFWRSAHFVSADVSLLIIALHIALHWQWIVAMLKCYVFKGSKKERVCDPIQGETAAAAKGIGR